jgi:hypothetical protein
MPLSFPTQSSGKTLIQNVSMRLRRTVAVTESPFTYDQQVFEHQGARWEAEVTLRPLSHSEARSVEAFIVALKGRSGTFNFGHPLHNISKSISLSAATAVRDETISATGDAVDAGNYFQLGDYLYMVTEDFSGSGSMSVQPPIRQVIADATQLDFSLPQSTWRMSSNDIGWSTDVASTYGFTFAFIEAI